jgi:hypothetical protein
LPLDYNIEDQTLELVKLSSIVPQSNLGTFTNNQSQNIENTLKLPSLVLQKSLNEYNEKKATMSGNHSLLNVVDKFIDKNSNVTYKFPLDKESIVNSSSYRKSLTIQGLGDSLLNSH